MKKLVLYSMFLTVSLRSLAQANDLCGNSQLLIVDNPCISGTTTGAGIEDPSIDPTLYPADVWYSFEATTNFTVVYVYPDPSLDPDLYMFDNCGGNVFAVGTAGLFAGEIDSVFIETMPGTSYYISVVGWQDAPYGDFCIEVLSRTDDGMYDPCEDAVNLNVSDPCLEDHVNNDTIVKGYTFTATANHTYLSLEIDGLFYLPAIAAFETDCYGQVIRDGTEPYFLEGNLFIVDFPTMVGQQYLFGVYHTDPSYSYQFPMDYCVDVQNLADIETLIASVIKVFPSPFKDQLTIEIGTEGGQVEIFDLAGRLMYSQSGKDKLTINTDVYAKGIYVVKSKIGDKILLSKIVKE